MLDNLNVNTKVARTRNSNFELLRIVAILLVVLFHYKLHAGQDSFMTSQMSSNKAIAIVLGSWGSLGVYLFWAISAYFLSNTQTLKLDKAISLIIKTSIFGVVILLISYAVGIASVSIVNLIKALLGALIYQYWFISSYLVILLLSPILNIIVSLENTMYFKIIMLMLLWGGYFVTFLIGYELFGRTVCGIFTYLLIAYYNKHPDEKNTFEKYRILGAILTVSFVILYEFAISYAGTVLHYQRLLDLTGRLENTESPFMMLGGIFIFYCFKNLQIKQSKIINFLGRYTLGVFLVHGPGPFAKTYLWDGIFKAEYFIKQPFHTFCLGYFGTVVIIFAIGEICDFLYTISIGKVLDRSIKKSLQEHNLDRISIEFNTES